VNSNVGPIFFRLAEVVILDAIESAVRMLSSAALYVSAHRNGIARLCSPRAKPGVVSSRDILFKQVTAVKNTVADPHLRLDDSILLSGVTICREYFNYMHALISHEWPENLRRISSESLKSHHLYQVAIESAEHIERALQSLAARTSESPLRVDTFILRFLLARLLFEDGLSLLGISASIKERDKILRTIIFQPEFKQAGISILSFFSEIVSRKYPNMDVGVRIEQQGNKVTLVIETPAGEIEKIEHELSNYGLVVTGQVPIEEYLPIPTDAMLLKHKLEIANLELRQTRDLLGSERNSYAKRIESLEDQIGFMRKIFDKAQYDNEQTTATLRQLAASNSLDVQNVLLRIVDMLEKNGEVDQRALHDQVVALAKQSPSVIDRLNELFIKGSIQGAAGNYLYAALQTLPKYF
jgi:hypothetical protein